jgi:hypothetical protein
MKRFFFVLLIFIGLMFGTCHASKVKPVNSTDISIKNDYQLADFNSLEKYFQSFFDLFDTKDIMKFYYANLTNHSVDWIPGPSVYIIEGYFEVCAERWDFYTKNHDWVEVSASDNPNIFGDNIFHWFKSNTFDEEHKPKRIYGRYYICNEKKIIFFSLFRD